MYKDILLSHHNATNQDEETNIDTLLPSDP